MSLGIPFLATLGTEYSGDPGHLDFAQGRGVCKCVCAGCVQVAGQSQQQQQLLLLLTFAV